MGMRSLFILGLGEVPVTAQVTYCFISLDSAVMLILNEHQIYLVLKMGHSRLLFLYFRVFISVDSKQMLYIKVC